MEDRASPRPKVAAHVTGSFLPQIERGGGGGEFFRLFLGCSFFFFLTPTVFLSRAGLSWSPGPGSEDLMVGGSERTGVSPGRPAGGRRAGGATARSLLCLRSDVLQTHPLPGGGGGRGAAGQRKTTAAVRLQEGKTCLQSGRLGDPCW